MWHRPNRDPLRINQLSASTGPTSTALPTTCLDASGEATNCWAAPTFPYVRTASSNNRCWKPFVRQPEVICTPTPSASAARAAFWIAASNAGSSQAITGLVASNGEMVCPSGRYPPMVSVAAGPIENAASSGAGDCWAAGVASGLLPAAAVGAAVGFDGAQAASNVMSPMPATVKIRSGIPKTIWQARDVDLPQPDAHTPHLADVVPSVLAAMGVTSFERRIELAPDVHGACVLLIDGLGAELLDAHVDDAPVMAELRGPTLQAGFPSTTVAGLAAVGTGCRSGEHGLVGLSFRLPGIGVINPLRWRSHPCGDDLRDVAPPVRVQRMATTFERAARAGVAVSVVCPAEFSGSGLTRAILRGGEYVGVHALGDLASGVRAALADGGFCYGYHSELDLLGHVYGPGSKAWRMQLRQVDRLVESIVEGLGPGGLLAVVADHGMVEVDASEVVDIDACEALLDGVDAIGGEPRARHVYVADGAGDAVLAAWRETLAQRAWVVSRDEAIAAGWFGDRVGDDARFRIGDVVAAARGDAAMMRRTAESLLSSLIGQHGSLTTAEQRVPLLLAYG